MPTARPMIPSSDRLVSNTRVSPNCFCRPFGDEMHAALATDVLAEHEHLRIHLELVAQRAPHRLGESDDVVRLRRASSLPPSVARSARERPPNASGESGVSSA